MERKFEMSVWHSLRKNEKITDKFLKSIKICKENEIKIKKEQLLKSYAKHNNSDFWKDIKTLKKTNKEIFSVVDGKTDQNEILNIFKNKYRTILDDPLSQTRPKTYDNILEKINSETHK